MLSWGWNRNLDSYENGIPYKRHFYTAGESKYSYCSENILMPKFIDPGNVNGAQIYEKLKNCTEFWGWKWCEI